MFIVHGHDNEYLFELKNYLQNVLKLGKPVILREKASCGKSVIEKFDSLVRNIDLVFALLTPDDIFFTDRNKEIRRARQNIIFEIGFFYSKLQRTSGKIILLKKDNLELPSDLSGVIYIDISNGIESAGEEIRRELIELGWL